MEWHELIIVVAAAFAASSVQSFSGFGFGLIIVPLLALAIGPRDAVVLSNILAVLQTVTLAYATRRFIEWPVSWRIVAGSLVGLPLGLWILVATPVVALQIVIAIAVLISTVVVMTGVTFPASSGRFAAGIGLISGVLRTSTSMSGPPIVVYLQGRGITPQAFRATLAAIFTGTGLVALATFAIAGRIDGAMLARSAVGAPTVFIGLAAGSHIFARANEVWFRRVVVVVLLCTAVAGIARTTY